MADQQDQSSLGGSVEKASASADASKLRGKSSSTTGYRKRQSTGTVVATLAEKRRRQTDPQTSQISTVTNTHRRSIDSTKTDNKAKGDRKGHGGSVGSLTGLYLFTFLIFQTFHVSIKIEGMKKNKSFSMFSLDLQILIGDHNRKDKILQVVSVRQEKIQQSSIKVNKIQLQLIV